MSVGTTARVRLSKACLVRYATYPHEPDVLAGLGAWKARAEADHAADDGAPPSMVEKFNHVAILYDQANLPGEMAPEEVARGCRSLIERRPLPERDHAIGLTSVVQARCRVEEGASERDVAAAANELLAILTASEYGAVRGGQIAPGVGLWARRVDPGWLVMLCEDEDGSERTADELLVGPLWKHEVAAHKAQRQFDQFRRLHRRLRERREVLHRAIDALSAVLARHGTDGIGMDPEAVLKQHAATTDARRVLIERVGRARRMGTSLEAQRANLQAMRLLLGSGAGLEAIDARRQQMDQMIAQVRAELDYAEPVLESAHDICALHQTALQTEQNEIEKCENNLREAGNRRIALLGLWLGLMQVFSSFCAAEGSHPVWRYLMALWTMVGVIGVAIWWFGTARNDMILKSQDHP